MRNFSELEIQLDKFKPQFFHVSSSYNFVSFLPVVFLNPKIKQVLESYSLNLVFLVNVFTRNKGIVVPTLQDLDYLFTYLNNYFLLDIDKNTFFKYVGVNQTTSYLDLFDSLTKILFLPINELSSHKERVIAEYVAFKRFYSLLISEYGNTK